MKVLGWILFAAGVLSGIAGAAKLPAEGADWPDTWPVALGGIVLGVIGVGLWHLAVKAERDATRRGESVGSKKRASAVDLLTDLIAPARALKAEAAGLELKDLEDRTDALLEAYVLPFAEVRHQMIDRFGMARGADILVTVAYGERILNRVWSAAADGHLPEALACVPEAVEAFEEAAQQLEKASS